MVRQSIKTPATGSQKPSVEQLEVRKAIDPPPVADVLEKAKQALAQKVLHTRRHKCAICGERGCSHYERVDIDTGEHFMQYGPDLGKK